MSAEPPPDVPRRSRVAPRPAPERARPRPAPARAAAPVVAPQAAKRARPVVRPTPVLEGIESERFGTTPVLSEGATTLIAAFFAAIAVLSVVTLITFGMN